LDFIVKEKESLADLEGDLNNILIEISNAFPFKPSLISSIKNDRLQSFIKYDIVPEIKANKELKIDILWDVSIPSYEQKKIIYTYPDFQESANRLNVYNLESVAADKISRIMDVDKEARHIYDLWYLLKLESMEIPKLKNELIKRFGFKLYFPNLIKVIRSKIYRRAWKIRLEKQVPGLPPYESVIAELEEFIKNKLIDQYQE